MPLSFEEAKLRYNPDPEWQPKRDSAEYHEIITLMKQSGATFHAPTNRVMEVKDAYENGYFRHPIEKTRPPEKKTYLSKRQFLSVSSNRRELLNAMIPREVVVADVPQVVVTKETLKALKTYAKEADAQKKMSKREWLTFHDNKEFLKQHALVNKGI
jgi:hypothetical protein